MSEDLTGIRFKGTWRNPREDPEEGDFELRILYHDPCSGLLLARAEDELGESGIIGYIKGEFIQFYKKYLRERGETREGSLSDSPPPLASNFRTLEYFGRIIKPDETITAGGEYHEEGVKKEFGGSWRMDSVSE